MFESLGMMQIAFMALSWYYMIGLFIFGLWFVVAAFSESLEGSVVMLLLFLGLTQFVGVYDFRTIDVISLFYTIAIYLTIGCVWSLFKYKITAKNIADKYIKRNPREPKLQLKNNIICEIKNNIEKSLISYWILFFPFGVISFIFGDFVNYIVSKLGKIYSKIAEYVANSVVSNINIPTEAPLQEGTVSKFKGYTDED